MGDSPTIPELQFNHPDGRPRSRIEMELWLREQIPKVHWLRIIATKTFGLPKPISWDMREIVLKHWLLDEMVRRQYINGDLLGVNSQAPNDEGELRQFTQRLAAMIQMGNAVQPQHAEGVDMGGFQPPPPPVMGGQPPVQNGAPQQAYPPGPPAPPQYAQPPMPPPPPQQPQYAQPPVPPQMQPQLQPPPGPMGPPGGYAAPPQPPGPPMGPSMGGPPMGPPGPPAPSAPTQGRRGRGAKNDQAAGPPPAAPVPPMTPAGPPQGFAPAPTVNQGFAPIPTGAAAGVPVQQSFNIPMGGTANTAPAVDLTPLFAKIDQLQTSVNQLQAKADLQAVAITVLGRAMYQRQGTADVKAFLTELGIPLPQ